MLKGLLDRLKAPDTDWNASAWPARILIGVGCLSTAALVYLAMWMVSQRQIGAPHPSPAVRFTATKKMAKNVAGLLQFRGNASRTFYGQGPVPQKPRILWRFPDKAMCSESPVGKQQKTWCGTGWTGQPVIWERPDGITEVIVGAYDQAVHFIDLHTGKRTRPDFKTDDIIKGTVTLDPDGDPLLYFGCRDNKLRVVALDREVPLELWHLNASFVPGIWNDDWDGNPLVLNDILYEGGENGYLFAFRLHRDYDSQGLVKVQPELLLAIRGWTKELLRKVGDQNVSIESSVAAFENRLYFANSAGRVVGLDISKVHAGRAPIVFDYWMGDDVDATIVIDEQGMLYVAAEMERYLPRSAKIGQLAKLDPYRKGDPLLWGLHTSMSISDLKGGIWSTPALGKKVLYVTTNAGELLVVDRKNGQVLFRDGMVPHAWSSPVLIEDNLIVATCNGEIRNYSLRDPTQPVRQWTYTLPTKFCIESTPAVWKGHLVVGARDGFIYALSD